MKRKLNQWWSTIQQHQQQQTKYIGQCCEACTAFSSRVSILDITDYNLQTQNIKIIPKTFKWN